MSKIAHILDGKTLIVTLHEPTRTLPYYKNKILIKVLNPSTTQDCLFNFIESKTVFRPTTMIYHVEQAGVAMVTFENEIGIYICTFIFNARIKCI